MAPSGWATFVRPRGCLLSTKATSHGGTQVCGACGKQLDDAPNFCPACGGDLRGTTPLSDTLSGPWSGKVVANRYRLIEKLGEGGMGAVYKVEHVRIGKVLALKVLRPDNALDRALKTRFLQEARVVAKLSHPNTVQVFDSDEGEDGSLYIAMEYLPGRDLSWHLRAHGPMTEERVLAIGIAVLASLGEAHAEGVVHRDIKPANVMLVRRKGGEEQVKLLDFGIAKLLEAEGRKSITGSAEFVGTPAYMSPEQIRGDSVDARSDLYSVGCLLYELLAGRPPFDEKAPMATIKHHLATPVPSVGALAPQPVSPALERVLLKALEKAPEDRYQDAGAMRAALEKVRRDLGAVASDFTPGEDEVSDLARREDFDRFERRLRAGRVLAPLTALLALLAAGVWGTRFYQASRADVAAKVEREPNEVASQATRIAVGTKVTGHVGPADVGKADFDTYVVDVPAGRVSVRVTGVPDLNLVLQVAQQADGADTAPGDPGPQYFVDDQGLGQGEQLDGWRARPGPLYVRITEAPFHTEGDRAPREKSRADYYLEVDTLPLDELEPSESEPNDSLETAEKAPVSQSLKAWAGPALEYPPAERRRVPPSGVDFFQVDAAEDDKVAVVVVPPEQGRICVVDGADWETWLTKRTEGRTPAARAAQEPRCEPVPEPRLFALKPTGGRRVVRVQALDDAALGLPYRLAFATSQSNGLAGVVDLARQLQREERLDARRLAVTLATQEFAGAPQVAELQALLR